MTNIRTSRKSGFVFRQGGKRRETSWLTNPYGVTALAVANTAALTASLNAGALALRPFTVVRVRGSWNLRSDQLAATENFEASMAYSVVSDQASAIGVTAVPTPETDRGSDLFFVYESIASQFLVVSAIGMESAAGISKDFDSRAMRKVEEGQDLVITIENSSLSNGTTLTEASRILVKLH